MRGHDPAPDQLLFLIRTFDELVEMHSAADSGDVCSPAKAQ